MKLQDLFSLKGKVAIVTGGGRGIGRFIATGLAEAGADVVITSRKMKNLEVAAEEISKEYGVTAFPIACDVGSEEAIDKMLKTVKEKFPRIDILVNNAGATWGGADSGISSGEMGSSLQCQCPGCLDYGAEGCHYHEGAGRRKHNQYILRHGI